MTKISKILLGLLVGIVSIDTYAGTKLLITFKPTQSGNNISKVEQQRQRQVLMQKMSASKVNQITKLAKHKFTDVGPLATGGRVIEFDEDLSKAEISLIIDKLKRESDILYVDEDIIFYPTSNQTNVYQWDMFKTTNSVPWVSTTYYGDNFFDNNTNNSPPTTKLGNFGQGIVVAVLDTGYTPHPNFESNLVSGHGYTFISDCRRAGTCPTSTPKSQAMQLYTADGLDLGDYLTYQQYNTAASDFKYECGLDSVGDSSWHGTHVTGTIIGQGSSNFVSAESGVLGGAYKAQVMPIRVLGKCGGMLHDIINGMMWASGHDVFNNNGQPIPKPSPSAKVLNMSLSGISSTPGCLPTYQQAIDTIIGNGTIIVVAAGNYHEDVQFAQPASCNGVISVAAVGPNDRLANYSNYGTSVTISASGGNYLESNGGVLSTMFRSLESYGDCNGESCFIYTGLNSWQGTSMAAPHVAAAVADILAMKSNATNSEVIQILENSAESFISCDNFTYCVPNRRLNAQKAVEYVTESVNLLTPEPMSLTFSLGDLNAKTVVLANKNMTQIVLESFVISGNNSNNFVIESQTCIVNQVLQQNQSCTISVKPVNILTRGNYMASLYILNSSNYKIASVNLSISAVNVSPTPTPAPIYNTKNGGCTMVEGGKDIGVVFLLLGVSIYYYRRKKIK